MNGRFSVAWCSKGFPVSAATPARPSSASSRRHLRLRLARAAAHDHVGLRPRAFPDRSLRNAARLRRSGRARPVPHRSRPAPVGRRGLAAIGAPHLAGRSLVFRDTADRRPIGPGGRRELLRDEPGRMLAERFRVLRRLHRDQTARPGRADRPAVRALALRQPGEEGLGEVTVDGLRVGTHLAPPAPSTSPTPAAPVTPARRSSASG